MQSKLTAREVGGIFGVKPAAVSKWRKQKKIEGIAPPRRNRSIGYRYTVAQIDAFVRQENDATTMQQARAFYEARGYDLTDAS